MSATDEDNELGDLLPIEAIAWPADRFELELRKPVQFADETFSVLMLREPTCGEWEEIFAQPVQLRRRFAVSRIAGIPMKAVAMMGIGDVLRGEAYLNSFFEVGQAIGAN